MPNFTESSEATRAWPPSSQPPLLGAGPLRTGRDSFPASGSGPANASFRETRSWNGKWFSVTRRTAKILPLNEWVSRRCKALTLPHLPSFTAFTIRTWSRRTLRCLACQSMACHSAASLETAPTACAVVICFASYADLPRSLVCSTSGKSARFRAR